MAGEAIGVVGSLGSGLAGFEIDPQVLRTQADSARRPYRPLSRYPASRQDLTLRVASTTLYADLLACLEGVLAKYDHQSSLDLLSIWSPPNQTDHKHVSWRLQLVSHDQTLQTAAVSAVVEQLVAAAKGEFGASLVA